MRPPLSAADVGPKSGPASGPDSGPASGRPLPQIRQSPRDPGFVQDPYPFYDRLRRKGPLVYWHDYGLVVSAHATVVGALLRDRRLGREAPPECAPAIPAHLAPFYAVEQHSMLELEPPRHGRLRGLVLRAFTSRRIAALEPEIADLAHELIDALPADSPEGFDLLTHFAQKLPVIVIARMLGVPEERADDLLAWSHAMVGMYQAGRDRGAEDRAVAATEAFVAFLRPYLALRRRQPGDDLITHLLAAEADGARLSEDELIATCILLLNAGHEATVHMIGNGMRQLLGARAGAGPDPAWLAPEGIAATVEEILRHDPPLHLFTRWVYEDLDIAGHRLTRGQQVGCLLAGANRDPQLWHDPARFDPTRPLKPATSFGAGLHFCLGAPLARLEMQIALPILWQRLPGLALAAAPRYGDVYHFHGLTALMLRAPDRRPRADVPA